MKEEIKIGDKIWSEYHNEFREILSDENTAQGPSWMVYSHDTGSSVGRSCVSILKKDARKQPSQPVQGKEDNLLYSALKEAIADYRKGRVAAWEHELIKKFDDILTHYDTSQPPLTEQGEEEILSELLEILSTHHVWRINNNIKYTDTKLFMDSVEVYNKAMAALKSKPTDSLNNKQWPTVTDNDFRKIYRSLEVAVERLKHHEFHNRDIIEVLELILNENKHFKL